MPEIKNPEVYRRDIVSNIETLIAAAGGTADLAKNIEKSVFNYAIREAAARKVVKKWTNSYFVQLYIDRLRSIYINLKNAGFLARIISGEITPENLTGISHLEMAPEQWSELMQKKMQKENNKYNEDDGVYTDMFQCRKCKSRKVRYFEMQTRSADEPCTIFCSCENGHNWRIG